VVVCEADGRVEEVGGWTRRGKSRASNAVHEEGVTWAAFFCLVVSKKRESHVKAKKNWMLRSQNHKKEYEEKNR